MPQTETGFAEVNGARVYYETAGAGYPLVMLHAGIADSRMWDGQFETFAEHYRVVRYDARGFGKTAMVAGDYAHRHDLYELMKTLKIEKAYLMGCSLGGMTAVDFALEHPEMAAALVLVGPGLSGFEYDGDVPKQWAEIEAADEAGDIPRVVELELQVWVDGVGRTPDQVDPAVRELVREMNMIAMFTPPDLGKEHILQSGAAGRLGEIRAPTLIIVGDLDVPGIQARCEALAQGIAGARKVMMPGTAHVPNMEQPAEFNRYVLEFLGKL
jgi:pimeloyl-ACP methyl ester carboxylesterase